MKQYRALERLHWFHWLPVRCVRRNPRAVAAVTICTVLLVFALSPGYEPIYGHCRLPLPESHAGANNVTFGRLALDFGREIHLRLFSDPPNSSSVGRRVVKLHAMIGRTVPIPSAPYRLVAGPDRLELIFPGSGIRLSVSRAFDDDDDCYRIAWESCSGELRDSVRLTGARWYGGPAVYEPRWPMSELRRPWREAVVTGDVYRDYYGGVVERFWISSEGAVVHVDYDVPLFVTVNGNDDGYLDFVARSVCRAEMESSYLVTFPFYDESYTTVLSALSDGGKTNVLGSRSAVVL